MTDIEFIGIAATQEVSETTGPNQVDGIAAQTEAGSPVGAVVNPHYVEALARAHEGSGFDRVLIAHTSAMPDGFVVADQILSRTARLGVLLAHRPGFLAPTLAARSYATLDAFHPGRVAMHVITGGDDVDQQRDGDFADKATRYARTDDFLTVVRQEWESETPFDHEGDFYRVKGGWSSVRPATPIPVYFGGASEDAGSASASGRSWPTRRRRPGPAPRRSWPRPSSAGTPPAVPSGSTARTPRGRSGC